MTFRVLLVDDNFDHRFLTKRALRGLEAEGRIALDVAEDGEEAWARLQAGPAPDLVLLDIKMPRRDGFELLRDIRAHPALRHLHVVMLTSSENRLDLERARELGANEYVTKPLDAREFQEKMRDTVAACLARHAAG